MAMFLDLVQSVAPIFGLKIEITKALIVFCYLFVYRKIIVCI